jgi:hypothetical protein
MEGYRIMADGSITETQARILFAETDAIRQDLIELRARERARDMAWRRVLLAWIDEIDKEWRISPSTRELMERARR